MTDGRRKLSLFSPRRRSSAEAGSGSGGSGTGVGPDPIEEPGQQLDEEMEKVFSALAKPQFGASSLTENSPNKRRGSAFGERDYSMHRKKSYPHTHVPLKALRSSRRSISTPRTSESEAPPEAGASGSRKMSENIPTLDTGQSTPTITEQSKTSDSFTGTSPPTIPSQPDDEDSGSAVRDENITPDMEESKLGSNLTSDAEPSTEPQLSERAAMTTSLPDSSDRRVQFIIGKPTSTEESPTASSPVHSTLPDDELLREELDVLEGDFDQRPKRKQRHHHHHHHHHKSSRKFSLQEDPVYRKRLGSDFAHRDTRRTSVQPEEAATLHEQDLDDLSSHRFEDSRGLRRPKLKSQLSTNSVIHIGRRHDSSTGPFKKAWDHSPHEVFVQLDELHGEGDEREWKETARWIKYEEDVMEGSERWGRPHVASLSFHSLLNLRRCLENGVVLLDLDERDLPGVAYRVVEQMVVDELIDPEDRSTVMRSLLLRHRHVNDNNDRFRFGMRRNVSSYTSLQNLTEEKGKPRIVSSASTTDAAAIAAAAAAAAVTGIKPTIKNNSFSDPPPESIIDMKEELTYGSSSEDLKKVQKESILKRIPLGAEATTVLVGAVDFLEQPTIAFVRLAEGIFMPSLTEVSIPVRFLFILLGPNTSDLDYHEIGRSISTLMANEHFHKIAYKADERKELLSAINEFLDDSIVLPPGDWERKALLPFGELKAKSEMIRRRKSRKVELDKQQVGALALQAIGPPPPPDPLTRTRKPFGGLINDIKRRMPFYVSDIVDGLNPQCMAAAIFMYFAAVSGAITFGGLIGDKTENLIGISETLVSTSAAGIIFALLAGQPLIIIGTTGPLLLFDESLYSFCITNNVDFLAVRVYIGFWIFIIAFVIVCFEGSVLVKLFTRFTEEIFAALISVLYIVEAFMKLYLVFLRHPLVFDYCNFLIRETNLTDISNETFTEVPLLDYNLTWNETESFNITEPTKIKHDSRFNQPNTALFCTILALGTFFIAYYLRQFRNSQFLGRSARRALGDFGVPIAIITMVALDYLIPEVYTEKLKVPEGLNPTSEAIRGWIIPPSSLSQVWIAFAAIAPAALVYILLFMETHICELIIDKKERKLKKGSGFHLDIVLVSLLNVGCGLLGTPWMCAATVRSISHVSALTVLSTTHAPGDAPHIIEVKEQRMSALIVSVLIGLSVLMAPLLRLVPISVLFGVFLYMGVSSTNGIQFFDRLQLFFMPVKHHPQAAYVRKVHSMKMHLFTMIQLMCLAILWIVKSTQASLAFPFFLILMVPLRAQLRFLFTPSELRALDSEEADEDEEDEPDFYTEAPLPG